MRDSLLRQRRSWKALIRVLFIGSALLSGPSGQGQTPPAQPPELRLLFLPTVGTKATLERYQPLTDYLNQALGRPIRAASSPDYESLKLPLIKNEFELAYLAPLFYAQMVPYAHLEVLALELDTAGNRNFHSLLICRADRNFQTLEDTRGKVLAFVNLSSTSGFLDPIKYFLATLRETPQSFAGKVVFAGDHDRVVRGVYSGEYDVGATNDMDFGRALQAENLPASAFRVLWRNEEPLPGPPVCVRSDLPPETKAAILKALLDFNQDPAGLEALHIGGFAPASAQDYATILSLSSVFR